MYAYIITFNITRLLVLRTIQCNSDDDGEYHRMFIIIKQYSIEARLIIVQGSLLCRLEMLSRRLLVSEQSFGVTSVPLFYLPMTSAAMTTWDAGKQLLETLESAAAKGHHEQVLEESTTACIQMVQLYMGFLDLRAKTRAIRGQFDTALDDAATMQQLAPASAMGYLRGGYIYDMRGLRREAIRVYDQGLNHVSTDDPAYQRVVVAKSSSEEALNHRFDFMDRLPPDILMNIVPRFVGNGVLPSDKEYPYLNVSKRWHDLIPPIASFHFVIKQPKTLDQGHDHLVSVSRHVKALTLQSCPKTINRFFHRASFETLTQLTIKGSYGGLENLDGW